MQHGVHRQHIMDRHQVPGARFRYVRGNEIHVIGRVRTPHVVAARPPALRPEDRPGPPPRRFHLHSHESPAVLQDKVVRGPMRGGAQDGEALRRGVGGELHLHPLPAQVGIVNDIRRHKMVASETWHKVGSRKKGAQDAHPEMEKPAGKAGFSFTL
jgi:hypothetical protein